MNGKFKNSTGSARNRHCCTGDALRQYKFGALEPLQRAEVYRHLKTCAVCRDTYLALADGPEPALPPFGDRLRRLAWLKNRRRPVRLDTDPGELAAGQVWTTCPPSTGEAGSAIRMGIPVLIIYPGDGSRSPANRIRAMAISPDTGFHHIGETFLLDAGPRNPLGYPALVELFNEIPVPAGRLAEYRGRLPEKLMDDLRARRTGRREAPVPGASFRSWKTGEIDAAAYLAAAVTAGLWDDETHTIPLRDYRIAADSEGVRIEEIHPHVVADTEGFSLWLVQVRDRIELRFHSDAHAPEALLVSDSPRAFERRRDDAKTWDAILGHADQMPEDLTVALSVAGEPFTFRLRFVRPSR